MQNRQNQFKMHYFCIPTFLRSLCWNLKLTNINTVQTFNNLFRNDSAFLLTKDCHYQKIKLTEKCIKIRIKSFLLRFSTFHIRTTSQGFIDIQIGPIQLFKEHSQAFSKQKMVQKYSYTCVNTKIISDYISKIIADFLTMKISTLCLRPLYVIAQMKTLLVLI